MVDELMAVIDSAAGSYADEGMGIGVVWNGSLTFNVFNLYTGEACDVFMVEEVPTADAASEKAREWVDSIAWAD